MTRDERLRRLEHQMAQMQRVFSNVAAQMAEQNLRIRFVMDWFGLEQNPPGGVVDAAGRPVTAPLKMSLYEIYQAGGRKTMMARLEGEMAAITQALTAAEQEDLNAFEQDVYHASTSENGQINSSVEAAESNRESGTDGPSSETSGAAPQRRAFQPAGAKAPGH